MTTDLLAYFQRLAVPVAQGFMNTFPPRKNSLQENVKMQTKNPGVDFPELASESQRIWKVGYARVSTADQSLDL
jgi:hypothetical protein